MTVKVDLNPEMEAGLLAQAQARGLSLEDYVLQVLRERSTAGLTGKTATGSAAKARAFVAFAQAHRTVGSLTDQSVTRSNLIRDGR